MIIYINYSYVVKIWRSEANTKYLGNPETYFLRISKFTNIFITYKFLNVTKVFRLPYKTPNNCNNSKSKAIYNQFKK